MPVRVALVQYALILEGGFPLLAAVLFALANADLM